MYLLDKVLLIIDSSACANMHIDDSMSTYNHMLQINCAC